MKQCTDALAFLTAELDELERRGLRRRSGTPGPADALSFCTNDYLGLAANPAPRAPGGAGASRLIAGDRDEHRQTERAFASWLGAEDALLFTSGYAANVGTVSALARPGDLIVSDELNHASLIDGARLSRARVAVVPHADVLAVRRALAQRPAGGHAWVLVESYYSMDADGPDLRAVRDACDEFGAGLIVDEAHALGVLGPGGRGLCAEAGVVPDVLVGTLGKAFGSQGAFVLGPGVLREWLWNRARSFVFSTGSSPAAAAAATANLKLLLDRPHLPGRVLALAERLRSGLRRTGLVRDRTPDATMAPDARPALLGFGHIVPLVVGAPERAVAIAERLRLRGIAAHAVRPPTVPPGTSRLRLTVTARHQEDDIDRAVAAFVSAVAGD